MPFTRKTLTERQAAGLGLASCGSGRNLRNVSMDGKTSVSLSLGVQVASFPINENKYCI